jgi:oligopeptide transport system permease protein
VWAYIVRRLTIVIPSLLLVYTLIFALIRATPGGPWDHVAGRRAIPQEIQERLDERYHLNDPVYVQYLSYLWGVLHGDLGYSYHARARAVADIIRDFLPVSFQLGLAAWVVSNLVGISVGVISALNPNSWFDRLSTLLGVTGISVPSFVGVTLLVLILARGLHLVPTAGWNGLFSRTAIIPILAMALPPVGWLVRFTRTMMTEVLREDYIRTARSKGLPERTVTIRHALKNALIPVATMSGMNLADYIVGTFYVETIYGIPGLGRYFVLSTTGRDYPVLLALFLLYAIIIWFMAFLIDIAYGFLDPRVRFAR